MKILINATIIIAILYFVYLPFFNNTVAAYSLGFFLNKDFLTLFSLKKIENQINSFSVPSTFDNEINIQVNKSSKEYTKELVKIWNSDGFGQEDFKNLKKNGKGAPLLPTQIAKSGEISGFSRQDKKTLKIWLKFSQQIVDKMKTASINKTNSQTHKSMLSWYKYHVLYLQKLTQENLTRDELKNINKEYTKNANLYLPKIANQLSAVFGGETRLASFQSLVDLVINSAKAAATAYNFGGRIITVDPLCYPYQGIVVSEIGPKPGIFWITYAVMILNAPRPMILLPTYAILGSSLPIPTVCCHLEVLCVVTYPVLFFVIPPFGTSLLPAI